MPGGWGAFFLTFAWLRARRMGAWAWAYLPFSTPVLLAAWLLAYGLSDACQRAIAGWGPALDAAAFTLIALGFILPPFVIRGLQKRGRLKERTRGMGVALAAQAIIVTLAATLPPSYGNYSSRARVADALSETAAVRAEVGEAMLANRPAAPSFRPTSRLKSVEVSREGTIKAVLAAPGLAGRTLIHSPSRGSGGIEWTCSSDLPDACLPAACRR